MSQAWGVVTIILCTFEVGISIVTFWTEAELQSCVSDMLRRACRGAGFQCFQPIEMGKNKEKPLNIVSDSSIANLGKQWGFFSFSFYFFIFFFFPFSALKVMNAKHDSWSV